MRSPNRLLASVASAVIVVVCSRAEPAWTELRSLTEELPRGVTIGISSLTIDGRELAATHAAVASHRFRLADGRFPETPAADRGPGGPLSFTVRGNRLIVYGEGPDGDDDGGVLPAFGNARNLFQQVGSEGTEPADGNLVFFGDGQILDPEPLNLRPGGFDGREPIVKDQARPPAR